MLHRASLWQRLTGKTGIESVAPRTLSQTRAGLYGVPVATLTPWASRFEVTQNLTIRQFWEVLADCCKDMGTPGLPSPWNQLRRVSGQIAREREVRPNMIRARAMVVNPHSNLGELRLTLMALPYALKYLIGESFYYDGDISITELWPEAQRQIRALSVDELFYQLEQLCYAQGGALRQVAKAAQLVTDGHNLRAASRQLLALWQDPKSVLHRFALLSNLLPHVLERMDKDLPERARYQ